jgi:RNA polymerase sigma-70 factor (ECF subfamily)
VTADPERVLAARRGDQQAFEELARAHTPGLDALARLLLRDRDAAADAVQDALVAAWRELPRLRDEHRFESWLTRILVNACRQQLRRNRSLPGLASPTSNASDASGMILERDRLARGFARLSAEHRIVLGLRYYLGWSSEEIADRLGVRHGTVRSRLRHALRQMRAAIEADDRASVRRVSGERDG